MWIVKIALERPYTFIVMALLLLILGPLTILRTPTDIFPNIGIPVVSVVWNYTGLPPDEMSTRIVNNFERATTTTVNDIEHIESNSLPGIGIVKIFFQPSVNIDVALSQVTAISQTLLRSMPPGTTPPLILSYNASSVAILQLSLSSTRLSDQELFDQANSFIRAQLASVQGASIPYPYGGKQRQIRVNLDQQALQARGLTAQDVSNALGAQNLILPAGTQKIGEYEYNVKLNASPLIVEQLNDLPIKTVGGVTYYIRDVAHVLDGYSPQTNIVHVNGDRAVLMTIQKTGNASTLDIIQNIKDRLPQIRAAAPPDLKIDLIGDQSLFVRAAVNGVIREGIIAAVLTGLMILLFLGSWRSTLIITLSIPLSILASLIALSAFGQTINIMTLGGLALAVGILVDDATVAIENINWHLEQGKQVREAILDGAQQIAIPALVSTLCICIVFVPMFMLNGVARFLFVPLAEAVVFAMLASYVLSRTLVPTLAMYWLKIHTPHEHREEPKGLAKFQARFEYGFARLRDTYSDLLQLALESRKAFVIGFLIIIGCSMILVPFLGEDFFPSVDAGQIKLHMRAHTGTRVEETALKVNEVEARLRQLIPGDELKSVTDNIGLPVSGINLSYSNSAPVGPSDADIMLTLGEDHKPSEAHINAIRADLAKTFPGIQFYFLPADIISQILDFGLPSPIDIQVASFNAGAARGFANKLFAQLQPIPGLSDLHIQQPADNPQIMVNVDRSRAQDLGLTQQNVATDLLITLSGTSQTAPAFWLNPKNGVSYSVVTQTPQYTMNSLEALKNIPIAGAGGKPPTILGALANISRNVNEAEVSHYDVQPVVDIYGNASGRDLGGIAADVRKVIEKMKKDVPKGVTVTARGEIETMHSSFTSLYAGLAFAILLVYLLIVVNFQSWLDPFIIITALPGALAGIVWMLFLTHTTLSVPALTGAIMCMGVATANSILVISFARERMNLGDSAFIAAQAAGFTRLRPVMMTALAMIIGMLPMALGMGEGGEQNAPLGRAVIGGLLFATIATLFFVPAVFTLIHGGQKKPHPEAEVPHHV